MPSLFSSLRSWISTPLFWEKMWVPTSAQCRNHVQEHWNIFPSSSKIFLFAKWVSSFMNIYEYPQKWILFPFVWEADFFILISGLLLLFNVFKLKPKTVHLFSHSLLPTSGNHQSFLWICELRFFLFVFILSHIGEIVWYLSSSVWLTSLSIHPLAPSVLSQMVGFFSFFMVE